MAVLVVSVCHARSSVYDRGPLTDSIAKTCHCQVLPLCCFQRRDLFYSVLREWEKNHNEHTWSMQEALGKKIR